MVDKKESGAAFWTISRQPEKKIPVESYEEKKERIIREALVDFPKVLRKGSTIDWEKVVGTLFRKDEKKSQELKSALTKANVFMRREDTDKMYFLVYEKRGGHDISLLYMSEKYIKSDILVVNSRVNAMLLAQALERMFQKQNIKKQVYVELRDNVKWKEYDPNKETKRVCLFPLRAGSTRRIG